MKISIVGGGNMGGAIAKGLSTGSFFKPQDISVINRTPGTTARLKTFNPALDAVTGIYDSLSAADIVVIAVKPWLVEEILQSYKDKLTNPAQILVSVASVVSLEQLAGWSVAQKAVFRVLPNTAIAQKQSMTFVSSLNARQEQVGLIMNIFGELGKAELIEEKLMSAATSLASCGIAYAFRYIRAAMEGGVEMGLYPHQAKNAILQTLRGAVELMEANDSHPEAEIDKVTTAGGITIKGLNEMEHAGFTSAVIRGLKASHVK
ncbi:MAG: NAD(P)-binding domain-containing protein [Prevotella sp.]|jgi:pyrroline-5-carboxylate reductase|nr:NAD(P)-binding domain-containing protein [Prevotella sp.]